MAVKRTPNFTLLNNDLNAAVKMSDKAKLNVELRVFFGFVYVGVKALVYLVKVLEAKL